MIDIIEIRVGNFFAHSGKVKEITETDMQSISQFLSGLVPIPINVYRLSRLNFLSVRNGQQREFQKFSANIMFSFHEMREDKFVLVINDTIRLKHIIYIHQLQNLYFDLTEDILKRYEGGKRHGNS